MCLKVPYASRREAEIAAARTSGGQRVYPCQFCGWWHLTHTSKRELKLARKGKRARRPPKPRPGIKGYD